MQNNTNQSSLEVWNSLQHMCGLELSGRDEDLAELLRTRIDPNAETVESAISGISSAQLLEALFQTVQPFSLMFKDVLEFYKKAGAREGKSQWKIKVGRTFLKLEHFEEFLLSWQEIDSEIEVPAIGFEEAWLLPKSISYAARELEGETGVEDIDIWLRQFGNGEFPPLPESLSPETLCPGLDEATKIVVAGLSVLRSKWKDRREMQQKLKDSLTKTDYTNAFAPWTIAQNETDNWLRLCVISMAIIRGKDKETQEQIGLKLKEQFSKNEKIKIGAKIERSTLERILSLPAWKNRYELYSVWIATEIIAALENHKINIHYKNGELTFPFKETRIADVTTGRPRVSLFSEVRTAASQPLVGKNRKNAIQPDFTIWTENQKKCVLVVEVKHYKRSSSNFNEALEDYSGVHTSAQLILLVNYGAAGSRYNRKNKERCEKLGNLTASNLSARNHFRQLVRESIGDPILLSPPANRKVIAIDTSGSMRVHLENDLFWNALSNLEPDIAHVALVDHAVRSLEERRNAIDWLKNNLLSIDIFLEQSIAKLLEEYESILFLTDAEGRESLNRICVNVDEIPFHGYEEIELLQIS